MARLNGQIPGTCTEKLSARRPFFMQITPRPRSHSHRASRHAVWRLPKKMAVGTYICSPIPQRARRHGGSSGGRPVVHAGGKQAACGRAGSGARIGVGEMALFKPISLPLRSFSSLSTMLGLVLNFHQAKNLFGKVGRVSRGRYQHTRCQVLTWPVEMSRPVVGCVGPLAPGASLGVWIRPLPMKLDDGARSPSDTGGLVVGGAMTTDVKAKPRTRSPRLRRTPTQRDLAVNALGWSSSPVPADPATECRVNQRETRDGDIRHYIACSYPEFGIGSERTRHRRGQAPLAPRGDRRRGGRSGRSLAHRRTGPWRQLHATRIPPGPGPCLVLAVGLFGRCRGKSYRMGVIRPGWGWCGGAMGKRQELPGATQPGHPASALRVSTPTRRRSPFAVRSSNPRPAPAPAAASHCRLAPAAASRSRPALLGFPAYRYTRVLALPISTCQYVL
jgi:hypothetical protein